MGEKNKKKEKIKTSEDEKSTKKLRNDVMAEAVGPELTTGMGGNFSTLMNRDDFAGAGALGGSGGFGGDGADGGDASTDITVSARGSDGDARANADRNTIVGGDGGRGGDGGAGGAGGDATTNEDIEGTNSAS